MDEQYGTNGLPTLFRKGGSETLAGRATPTAASHGRMKLNGEPGQPLALKELTLAPGGEWSPMFPGWSFVYLAQGVAYWMHAQMKQELACGSILILPPQANGVIRSSQLGAALCHYFYVEPKKLTGLLTFAEQRRLEELSQPVTPAIRMLNASEPLAGEFRRLSQENSENRLRPRLRMLELFARAFEQELASGTGEAFCVPGAKSRLEGLLRDMPAADLVDLEYDELVSKVGCGPRHFGRVFQQLVGMSFRQKQAEVRLDRARELLAQTESKVLEVAIESGYQSLSLFNFMFKKRFGTTPGKWRQRLQKRRM